MYIIESQTIGECWLNSIKEVLAKGQKYYDEDIEITEILGLNVKIKKPYIDDEIINKFGDQKIITHTFNKFKKDCVMKNRPFTYGSQIYNKNGVDQFEFLVSRLQGKRETKSATISLLSEGVNDSNLPCLNIIDAKIRDEKLILQFFFRSQNILGRQYANLLALAKIQMDLADRLNVDTGFLGGYVACAHIYAYDYEYAKSICANENIVIKDKFYTHGPKSIRDNEKFK